MAVKKTVKNEKASDEVLFTKEQLLASEKFNDRTDILNAILSAVKQYTVEAVEKEIQKYMKGKVN